MGEILTPLPGLSEDHAPPRERGVRSEEARTPSARSFQAQRLSCGEDKHLSWRRATKDELRADSRSNMSLIILIIVLLLVFGSAPAWGYSRNWGYGPGGGLGLILVILLILYLTGHL